MTNALDDSLNYEITFRKFHIYFHACWVYVLFTVGSLPFISISKCISFSACGFAFFIFITVDNPNSFFITVGYAPLFYYGWQPPIYAFFFFLFLTKVIIIWTNTYNTKRGSTPIIAASARIMYRPDSKAESILYRRIYALFQFRRRAQAHTHTSPP